MEVAATSGDNKRALRRSRPVLSATISSSRPGKHVVIGRVDIPPPLRLELTAHVSPPSPFLFLITFRALPSARFALRPPRHRLFGFDWCSLHIARTCPEFHGGAIRFRIYLASRRAISGVLSEKARARVRVLSFTEYTSIPDARSFQRDGKSRYLLGNVARISRSRRFRTILERCSSRLRRSVRFFAREIIIVGGDERRSE